MPCGSEAETEVGAFMAPHALPWIKSDPTQHMIQQSASCHTVPHAPTRGLWVADTFTSSCSSDGRTKSFFRLHSVKTMRTKPPASDTRCHSLLLHAVYGRRAPPDRTTCRPRTWRSRAANGDVGAARRRRPPLRGRRQRKRVRVTLTPRTTANRGVDGASPPVACDDRISQTVRGSNAR